MSASPAPSPQAVPADDADAFRAAVQAALDAVVDHQATVLAPLGPDAERLLAEIRALLAGGKRLRALFCRWGHLAVAGGRPLDDAHEAALVRACAALELLHASALVHDDLMDASDTRRGRPSTHRGFEAQHAASDWTGDPAQYGAAAAILTGDLLLAWADESLRRCGLPPAEVAPALEVFDACRTEVIAGQFLDVSVQARGRADVATAMTVLRYKSAKYSIERPLHVGAALAGADAGELEALSAYGLPLGEAFQLRDDVLGVFGDPAVTGKPAGDDLVEGKRTVLVALALEHAAPAEAAELDAALGRPLAPAEVERLRAIIEGSGALARVEALIADLTARALAALEDAPIAARPREALRALAEAATRRQV
ncbi:polyprenyl synthetase family protein [Nocardioides sp. TRM66260-LWL]|uniref:polyprenyl synthetase family protein n=1 Tax=Nocardioides sp. TRM66260-LWL TaxID=2874478 RepID=UPI001CC6AB7D|nr:polyprenyl synthetase family protein [Nocardioides sp. TRM66260-LWL]MBZ5733330.1 polyprenyl synthetase family protein [Nocardioides sp. TRM66260-LWL]